MSTTTTITTVCQIAENYGREIGLADFEIERIVHAKADGKDEWIIRVQFGELDPLIENEASPAPPAARSHHCFANCLLMREKTG